MIFSLAILWALFSIVIGIAIIVWIVHRVQNKEENDRKNIEIQEQILEQMKEQNGQGEQAESKGRQNKDNVCPYSNLEEAMKDAEQGNPDAQYWVGEIYSEGLGGTPCNKRKAAQWMIRSAEQGNDKAQCELGLYYLNGTGVMQDEKEGVKWLTESANHGNGKAQYNLGMCYQQGRGVTFRDEDAARAWFSKAKEQGYSKESEGKPRMHNNMGSAKFCTNCGYSLNEGAKFCSNCGSPVI